MSIFLTGATGFLGKNLLKRLLADGESVRVLARNPAALGVESDRLTIIRGDLRDDAALAEALGDAKRVYHVAAVVKEWTDDWSIFDEVNVRAFERLLSLAMERKVERIVHTSSFMAIGHTDKDAVADESLVHEPNHFHNPYERTKCEASRIAVEYLKRGAPIVTVLPGVIFGPGEITDGNIVVQMLLDMANGKFPGIPGDGKKLWSYSFVHDVALGHILAMQKGRIGASYILGGENITLDRLVEVASREMKIKIPSRHIPLGLLAVSAFGMELIARINGRPPLLTRGKVGVLAHNWAYSSKKAETELGYRITPFDEAFAQTVAWLRETGMLKN